MSEATTWALRVTDLVRDAQGVVQRVYFMLTGTDAVSGREQAAVRSVLLGAPGDAFIPFGDLVECEVLAWIADAPEVLDCRAAVERELAREPEPEQPAVRLPWASAELEGEA